MSVKRHALDAHVQAFVIHNKDELLKAFVLAREENPSAAVNLYGQYLGGNNSLILFVVDYDKLSDAVYLVSSYMPDENKMVWGFVPIPTQMPERAGTIVSIPNASTLPSFERDDSKH